MTYLEPFAHTVDIDTSRRNIWGLISHFLFYSSDLYLILGNIGNINRYHATFKLNCTLPFLYL